MRNRLIFRTEKDQSYFVVANEPFNDERLSWGARGILAYLLSKPDTWQSHLRDLVRQGPDGDTRVKKYLSELTKFGYLRRLKKRDKQGKIRWITEIYESPELNSHFKQNLTTGGKPHSGKPHSGKPSSGKPQSGKPQSGKPSSGKTTSGKPPSLVNTEKENTEKENTEKENTDGTAGAREERQKTPPTTKTAAAAAEFFKILDVISQEMAKPLQTPEALLWDLQTRGETPQSTKDAWEACKTNARKPSGAFVYWLKSGYLPQQNFDLKAKKNEDPPQFRATPPTDSTCNGGSLQETAEERKVRIAAELAAMQAKTAANAGSEGANDEQEAVGKQEIASSQDATSCSEKESEEARRARKKAELAEMLIKSRGGSR